MPSKLPHYALRIPVLFHVQDHKYQHIELTYFCACVLMGRPQPPVASYSLISFPFAHVSRAIERANCYINTFNRAC